VLTEPVHLAQESTNNFFSMEPLSQGVIFPLSSPSLFSTPSRVLGSVDLDSFILRYVQDLSVFSRYTYTYDASSESPSSQRTRRPKFLVSIEFCRASFSFFASSEFNLFSKEFCSWRAATFCCSVLRGSNLCLAARASSSCSSRSACIRQHTSAYVRHASAYVSRRQHTSAPRLAP
jgi:hypothetical protein